MRTQPSASQPSCPSALGFLGCLFFAVSVLAGRLVCLVVLLSLAGWPACLAVFSLFCNNGLVLKGAPQKNDRWIRSLLLTTTAKRPGASPVKQQQRSGREQVRTNGNSEAAGREAEKNQQRNGRERGRGNTNSEAAESGAEETPTAKRPGARPRTATTGKTKRL